MQNRTHGSIPPTRVTERLQAPLGAAAQNRCGTGVIHPAKEVPSITEMNRMSLFL
jgi:hypothetical protein